MKKYLLFGLGIIVLLAVAMAFWITYIVSGLPDVSSLKHYRPHAAAEVLDKDGRLLANYYDRKFRLWVPISAIPDIVIQAVVTAEDDTFFEHKGVNYKATWDALVHDLEKHRFARGGSTITQQMIKNVLLSREKTINRKVREYLLAVKAEELLTKRQILEIYLNEVEWGDNIFGIEAASRFYLDRHVAELTAAEAALLAGMLPNPRYFNPFKRLEKTRDRQERILFNMQQAKILSPEEYAAALAAPVTLRQEDAGKLYLPGSAMGNHRPCYEYALERGLLAVFGEHDLYRSGRTIKTTIDRSLQAELDRQKGAGLAAGHAVPDEVLAVKQGDVIRALVCGVDKEQEIRDAISSHWFTLPGYEVSVISLQSINGEQIVRTEDDKIK
jgi:membrane peptidoglycan carboxypeptidase